MTRGVFKDPTKKNVWNGSGMAALTAEERAVVMEKAKAKQKEMKSGWPQSVQGRDNWDREALERCDWEWAELIANSKSRKAHR